MKYYIKTKDDEYFVGIGGEFITKDFEDRNIYDTKKLALWYVDTTNLFGELKIINDTRPRSI